MKRKVRSFILLKKTWVKINQEENVQEFYGYCTLKVEVRVHLKIYKSPLILHTQIYN